MPGLYLYDCPTRVAATSDFTMIDMTSVSRRILSSYAISSTISKWEGDKRKSRYGAKTQDSLRMSKLTERAERCWSFAEQNAGQLWAKVHAVPSPYKNLPILPPPLLPSKRGSIGRVRHEAKSLSTLEASSRQHA